MENNSWEIHGTEIAMYARKRGSSGGSLPLYIPSLMINIPMGKAKVFAKPVNPSCFCNAKDCKPAVRKVLKQQNFVTVPQTSNRSFKFGFFRLGDKIEVNFKNSNVDSPLISTKIDNSRLKP